MKKIISLLCSAFIIITAVSSCGNNEKKVDEKTSDATSASITVTEASSSAVSDTPVLEIADNAVDMAASLKFGWNLGNTLDATGEGLNSETSWGQPTVTKELIQFVKESGFTSIRIPVSWSNHVDENNLIDDRWMSRVKEVVDYAYDCGLYVIINSHHDCERYYPSEENFDKSSEFLRDIWIQIANAFAEYDERLIFESMNEPRLKDTSKEWWFQSSDKEGTAAIECIVKLNQVFVDIVRSQDKGHNSTRYLMVPSYAASPDFALHKSFEMPKDTVSGKLIVSIHAYSPYDFAMNSKGYKDWDGSKVKDLGFMNKLDKKFTQNGYGVVIGEFGATNKGNLESRVAWAKDYTGLAASLGISCFLWDNGGTNIGEENFGMINRNGLSIYFPELLEGYLSAYNGSDQNDQKAAA